jgi:hypothetical protein
MKTLPTPRTDNEDQWGVMKDPTGLPTQTTVRIEFARELERELAVMNHAYDNAVEQCRELMRELRELRA